MARIAASLVICIAVSSGLAQSVFSTGAADTQNGSGREMSQWLQADDFTLSADTSLTGASVEWFTLNRLSGWDHDINWYIFADDYGSPGSLLASGGALNVLNEFEGSTNFDRYTTTFDLDAPVFIAQDQRYWFGLHFASTFDSRDDLYWADGTSSMFAGTHESFGGSMSNWVDVSGTDRAFALIPAPGSAGVLAGGMILLRRRRR